MPTPTPEAQETQKTNDEPQTAAQGTPPPDPGKVADADNTDKSKAKPPHPRPTPKKPQQPAQTTTARNAPPKIVVKPEGPEPSSTPGAGQISPNPPNTEVSHDQATTEQLLQSSESSINNLKRTLTTDEQAIVAQIRDYVNQSRQAIKDNDLTRAHTLALKAHLLSDELIKRR